MDVHLTHCRKRKSFAIYRYLLMRQVLVDINDSMGCVTRHTDCVQVLWVYYLHLDYVQVGYMQVGCVQVGCVQVLTYRGYELVMSDNHHCYAILEK